MGQSLAGLIMVHISYTSVSFLLLSLESSLSHPAPSPFLLDLLAPHVQVSRREGKKINDGYGVPEDSYGAPASSTVSSYEAPKYSSSTVPPCSYQAPTTTTTPSPSYGAPSYGRQQEQPVFPDILGFIGDSIGGILNKHNKNQPSQEYGCLSAPVDDGYGVPQETSYTAPETDAYDAPQSASYDAPQSASYDAPQSASYEAPQSDSYEAPQKETYEAPETDTYEASADNVDEIAVNERIKPVVQ